MLEGRITFYDHPSSNFLDLVEGAFYFPSESDVCAGRDVYALTQMKGHL